MEFPDIPGFPSFPVKQSRDYYHFHINVITINTSSSLLGGMVAECFEFKSLRSVVEPDGVPVKKIAKLDLRHVGNVGHRNQRIQRV